MFLSTCFFYSRIKKFVIIILKKLNLSKFYVVSVFLNMLYSKKRKHGNTGNQ